MFLAQILGGPRDGAWYSCSSPEMRLPACHNPGSMEILVYRFERRTWSYGPVWRLDRVEDVSEVTRGHITYEPRT